MDDVFQFFDPQSEFLVTSRSLPHWEQPGVTYFITIRTADSIPAAVLDLWESQRQDWLRRHGVDPQRPDWRLQLNLLPPRLRQTFHREFTARFERHLDDCHGDCVLRQPHLAKIVANSLRHFDGERYHLGDFVVMPNHIHLLAAFIAPTTLKQQCRSWTKYTAGEINRVLGRSGHFWCEPFDHLVRNREQFDRFRRYIAANPEKARLKPGEYLYYRRPDSK